MTAAELLVRYGDTIVHALYGALLLVYSVYIFQMQVELSFLRRNLHTVTFRLLQLEVRDERYLVSITQIVDFLHQLLIINQLILSLEVIFQKLLLLRIFRQSRTRFGSFLRLIILKLKEIVLGLEILIFTLPDPWSLRHGRVNLLEIKFILDLFFIDVGNHIWRLNKWH